MEKSDPTGALEDFQHAIELEPESADIFYHRGQVHFLMGNLEDAAKDYEKSISLNSTIAFAYIQLGVAMYRIGNHKDAIVRSFLVLFLFFFKKKVGRRIILSFFAEPIQEGRTKVPRVPRRVQLLW